MASPTTRQNQTSRGSRLYKWRGTKRGRERRGGLVHSDLLHRPAQICDRARWLRRRPGKIKRVAARGYTNGVARRVAGRAGVAWFIQPKPRVEKLKARFRQGL